RGGAGLSAAGERDPVPLELPVEGVAADAELGSRSRHVAAALLDDPCERGALCDLQRIGQGTPVGGQGTGSVGAGGRSAFPNLTRQVDTPHDASVADRERRADDVVKLADVAGPRIL